jgi:hypothetical protein
MAPKPDHHQGFAGADVAQQAGEYGAAAIGAGGLLFQDGGAAGGTQFVELRIRALFDRLARSVSHLLAVIEQLKAAGAHFLLRCMMRLSVENMARYVASNIANYFTNSDYSH